MTTWDEIIGHDWAVEVLRGSHLHDRIGHAYLITGPTSIGKTTLARTLAQAINCLESNIIERPCGRCRSCQLIASDRHPDVRIVQGEVSSRGKVTLKIDQIRQLQGELHLTPTEARYKVAILRQFETANPNAANAFLKTLEEPPNNVLLILTATSADVLLPTIPSRCQIIALRPLPVSTIQGILTSKWGVEDEQARLLAHLADGRPGWAVHAATDPAILELRESRLQLLNELLSQTRVGRFALAEELAHDPQELPDVLQSWLSWWRDLTLLANGMQDDNAITNIDRLESLLSLLDIWPTEQILSALKQTERALWQLAQNANTRLVLENLLLTYPNGNENLPFPGI